MVSNDLAKKSNESKEADHQRTVYPVDSYRTCGMEVLVISFPESKLALILAGRSSGYVHFTPDKWDAFAPREWDVDVGKLIEMGTGTRYHIPGIACENHYAVFDRTLTDDTGKTVDRFKLTNGRSLYVSKYWLPMQESYMQVGEDSQSVFVEFGSLPIGEKYCY